MRIECVNKDNSHSQYGLNKLVTDLIDKEYDDNEQETSETQTEVFALKTEVFAFASRPKAKAKPRRSSTSCSSSRTVPIRERTWIDIEPGAQSDQAYPVAKRLKFQHWSYDMWKSKMVGGGGNKKRVQYCTDPSGQEILCLRALQGHSGRSPLDPTLQDNVLSPNNFFEYILSNLDVQSVHTLSQIQGYCGRTKF